MTDYKYLTDTYVELERTDNEYNIGQMAYVKSVKGDCLYVTLDNGETFWTDVDSVYHD